MSDLFSGLTSSLKSTATALQRNEYVRKIAETINETVMNYSEAELAVREATNEDPWGPTGPQMKKIVEYTRSRHMEDFYNVYTPLFARMLENNKDAWRRVYKSLVLFDYLLKNGSERFVNESREKIYEIRRLESYKYIDEKGKDQGINIRHRAKLILEFLNDDEKLQAERRKANSDDKSKYRGYDQFEMKMSSSGFGSSSSSNWNKSASSDFNSSSDFSKNVNREVSNFAFSGNNRSPSPELGFANDEAEKKNANDDDDGFGDFVSSRSSCASKSAAADLFSVPVPAISPPAPTEAASLPRKPSLSNDTSSNFDLLGGLDSTSPGNPATLPAPAIDLFSMTPASTFTTVVQPKKSETSNVDLFGFEVMPPTTSTTSNAFGGSSNVGDIGFDAMLATRATSPSSVIVGNENKGNIAAPKVGNSFAGLDDFMNLSLSSSATNSAKPKTLNQMKGSN